MRPESRPATSPRTRRPTRTPPPSPVRGDAAEAGDLGPSDASEAGDATPDEGGFNYECDPLTVEACVTACGSTGHRKCYKAWGPCIPPVESCGDCKDDNCDGLADEGSRTARVACP